MGKPIFTSNQSNAEINDQSCRSPSKPRPLITKVRQQSADLTCDVYLIFSFGVNYLWRQNS